MSGGQMQRVAIARALVNDPEILLADEPTGALDSETSVQIMDILKEIARDRLVIMVTHNPELAETYSTRIIRLLDGKVISDSAPYEEETQPEVVVLSKKEKKARKKKDKTSMSFVTALSLSINNLLTKKTRTLLTSFAGSIGIIGIALILSVSTGVQNYIDFVQRDTLASYPITIEGESLNFAEMMMGFMGTPSGSGENKNNDEDKIYINSVLYDMVNSFNNAQTSKNNLKAFRDHILNSEDFEKYSSLIQFKYDYPMNIYTTNSDGDVVKSDAMDLMEGLFQSAGMSTSYMSQMGGMDLWEELLAGDDGELISDVVKEQYELIDGNWPTSYDEVVIIVNENNELSDIVLYTLGLITKEEILEIYSAMSNSQEVTVEYGPWNISDLVSDEAFFKLILSSEYFEKQPDGSYSDLSKTDAGLTILYNDPKIGIPLKISGIVKPSEEANSTMMSGSLAYTSALTQKVLELTAESDIIELQLKDKLTDIISGLPFKPANHVDENLSAEQKADKLIEYIDSLSDAEKINVYKTILLTPSSAYVEGSVQKMLAMMSPEMLNETMLNAILQQYPTITKEQAGQYLASLDDERRAQLVNAIFAAMVTDGYKKQTEATIGSMTLEQMIEKFNTSGYSDKDLEVFYDEFVPSDFSESNYDDVLKTLGYVTLDDPSRISIYCDTFEDKDKISELITQYNNMLKTDNDTANDEDVIEYTDYIALLMSSITTIINAISYVLIAFVAISLVVSSIMIGIITYISVLERTKEIGVLRSIGASKKDVSRVFNAETLIVGFTAGAMGIIITLLLTIPINAILLALTEITNLKATLPYEGAIILVIISMVLTLIAGLIPSRLAAKKDPVVALRSE
ncbi:MAG: FtsX-like permease family protein [Clostridiales bacterium]|nr:FtsX-like permease family protein [Clostridiales bacterium]